MSYFIIGKYNLSYSPIADSNRDRAFEYNTSGWAFCSS